MRTRRTADVVSGATPRRATLKDVARAAGVSQSTTSRALSGGGYVAAAVRERVRRVAAELGYVPHAMARSLRTQQSWSVGVLVPDLGDPFYADLAAGIGRRARTHGYTMTLLTDDGVAEYEKTAAESFVAMRTAGVIVAPLTGRVTAFLQSQHIPVVEVERRLGGAFDSVLLDREDAARRVTDHAVSLGHRRVALLVDEARRSTLEGTCAGYRRTLETASLPLEHQLVVGADEEARRLVVDALTRRDRPTAVLTASSSLAEVLWWAAVDLGLRVPHDLSIVSLEDAPWMSMVEPPLSAVAHDGVELGRAAMDQLLARIADPEREPAHTVLGTRFVARGSTAAPSADRHTGSSLTGGPRPSGSVGG